ncbi:MAG: conjugative relaxase [Nitrospinae bacterium]|nr:conjugative relaxase [Nitrospinota bacterium]
MVASIGALVAPAQCIAYFERDDYYTKEDPNHRESSIWRGRGAEDLGLTGPVDPDTLRTVLEGVVPDGSGRRLGRPGKDGSFHHRPGRDLTLSAPKSVSLLAYLGGDARAMWAHEVAVKRTLDWVERNAAETRMSEPGTGQIVRVGDQKCVIAAFRHDTSRNMDPLLHTHAVIANMVRGTDGKWRTMSNEKLYAQKMLIGALYRAELARGLESFGYRLEKTHADGRFEIAGVSREVIEAFSTRRAEIEKAMEERGLGETAGNQRAAQRVTLMTRDPKREADKGTLMAAWEKQAKEVNFDAAALKAQARARGALPREVEPAGEAVEWAVAHLSEREAVFDRAALLAGALAWRPGAVSMAGAEREVARLEKTGVLHAADLPGVKEVLTTEKAVAEERETIALVETGRGRGAPAMRGHAVDKALRNGPLTHGQREAVKLILTDSDRVVGVQGYAGTGKTKMLKRARALLEKHGYDVKGLAPSASAARTLEAEAGIESQTLQGFLARNADVAQGRLTRKVQKQLRAGYRKTALVVDEGSLASTREVRELLRISEVLRLPRVVLVGDAKQLGAVDAGKPFAQLQAAGMKTAVMEEIMRQRDQDLKAAVEATLAGDVRRAFEKLGSNVAEVKPDNLAGAAAARWLALPPEARANAGLMAPSHAIREKINAIVRERLVRDGVVRGPAFLTERLVSRGYTNPQKSLAANYSPGDVVAFHRPYKRIGVAKGDELRVAGVDHANDAVILQGKDGREIRWEPSRLAARTGGVEVYRVEHMELRQGDKVRWTRNDPDLGLMNSQAAEVTNVRDKRVTFRIEDGRILDMTSADPQLRHVDRAWASTVHAFQGRTVDTVIAAMEANHPDLTNQKTLYVEISRARDRAELVTDDARALRERLEAATGERIAALEAFGAGKAESTGTERSKEALHPGEERTPVKERTRFDRLIEI